MKLKAVFISLFFFCFPLCGDFLFGRVYLDINAPVVRKLNILVEGPKLLDGKMIKDTIIKDLSLFGYFNLFSNLKEAGDAGIDAVLQYNVETGSYGYAIDGVLKDFLSGEELLARIYSGKDICALVHIFLDDVVEALTGKRGFMNTKIAFLVESGKKLSIYLSSLDGCFKKEIVQGDVEKNIISCPHLSRDGRYLLYISFSSGIPQASIVDIETGKSENIPIGFGSKNSFDISPSGRYAAVSITNGFNCDIYLFDRPKNTLTNITKKPWAIDVQPRFSPDGKSIAFVSDRSGKPNIYIMGLFGENPKRITFLRTSRCEDPSWSPKGDEIAFSALSGDISDIYTIDLKTGNIKRLTFGSSAFEHPAWSPDGRFIIFLKREGERSRICICPKNGGGFLEIPFLIGNFRFLSWSP